MKTYRIDEGKKGMDTQKIDELIDTITQMKSKGVFENYIEYIEFPFYKNLTKRTRINFEFPLTVLVGKNGSGKSSTLHALYGAPFGYTCGDFWFSTEVDPILESGERNRFFYGYKKDKYSEIKEVMKSRMKRGSKTKKEDPDYWEPCRPILKDGMSTNKRFPPVNKNVVYIDFRAEVSAFDKVYHFSKDDLGLRKDLLRKRSKYLIRLFNGEPMRFPGMLDNKVGMIEELSNDSIKIIGDILGKSYVSIKFAEHTLFKNKGASIYMRTKLASGYSEANAGSGEVAVVQLVKQLQQAPEYSLVLLDEPEVSIHPAAQEKLKHYLLKVVKEKKIQVVISTHSPTLIENMPISAIKLFKTNIDGKFIVQEEVHYKEAFFDIENKVLDKKIIICEDIATKLLLEKSLKKVGKDQFFEVLFLSGGEKTLINHYIAPFALNDKLSKKVFIVLDGDMRTGYHFEENKLTLEQLNNSKFLSECVEKAYGMKVDVFPDGGDNGRRLDQECKAYICYLKYYMSNISFLPGNYIPEEIILKSNYVKSNYLEIIQKYPEINEHNAKEIVREISIQDHDDDKHINDTISILSNKWSCEDSHLRTDLFQELNCIFERE